MGHHCIEFPEKYNKYKPVSGIIFSQTSRTSKPSYILPFVAFWDFFSAILSMLSSYHGMWGFSSLFVRFYFRLINAGLNATTREACLNVLIRVKPEVCEPQADPVKLTPRYLIKSQIIVPDETDNNHRWTFQIQIHTICEYCHRIPAFWFVVRSLLLFKYYTNHLSFMIIGSAILETVRKRKILRL